MESLKKLLEFINDNWASIVVIFSLCFAIYTKASKFITDWKSKTQEEKVEAAKKAVSQYILVLVSQAEIEWNTEGSKLGAIKRAQVIKAIYDKYPVLAEVSDQETLLKFIDEQINEALKIVRENLRIKEGE